MAGTPTIRAELDDQRRLIEVQGIEISRQGREIALQLRRSADMQVQLDRILNAVQRAEPNLRPAQATPSNGNGHRAGARDSAPQGDDQCGR